MAFNPAPHPISKATLITTRQAVVGTFFGGPVALAYFVRNNCLGIGDLRGARRTLWSGVIFIAVWNVVTVLSLLLPKWSSFPFAVAIRATPFLCVIAARQLVP